MWKHVLNWWNEVQDRGLEAQLPTGRVCSVPCFCLHMSQYSESRPTLLGQMKAIPRLCSPSRPPFVQQRGRCWRTQSISVPRGDPLNSGCLQTLVIISEKLNKSHMQMTFPNINAHLEVEWLMPSSDLILIDSDTAPNVLRPVQAAPKTPTKELRHHYSARIGT